MNIAQLIHQSNVLTILMTECAIIAKNNNKTDVIVFGAKAESLKVTTHLESLSLKTKTQVRNLCVVLGHLHTWIEGIPL